MKALFCAAILLLSASSGFGKSHHHRRSAATNGSAFDSYLLTLSWSPEYCHGHPTDPQCTGGKHLGFVVHGLWPEYKSGGGPQNCGTQPGLANPSQMLDIMPTLHLIEHEWTTHGTCSGLSADEYFALIRKAYASIRIPTKFSSGGGGPLVESPAGVKKDFEAANGSLNDSEMMISCSGNYLQAVEICLTKGLSPTACTAPKDCRAQSIRIPPVQ